MRCINKMYLFCYLMCYTRHSTGGTLGLFSRALWKYFQNEINCSERIIFLWQKFVSFMSNLLMPKRNIFLKWYHMRNIMGNLKRCDNVVQGIPCSKFRIICQLHKCSTQTFLPWNNGTIVFFWCGMIQWDTTKHTFSNLDCNVSQRGISCDSWNKYVLPCIFWLASGQQISRDYLTRIDLPYKTPIARMTLEYVYCLMR